MNTFYSAYLQEKRATCGTSIGMLCACRTSPSRLLRTHALLQQRGLRVLTSHLRVANAATVTYIGHLAFLLYRTLTIAFSSQEVWRDLERSTRGCRSPHPSIEWGRPLPSRVMIGELADVP